MKSGFTLSELLVAMAIAGVIAALTVPGFVSRYQNDSQIMNLKKIYTELGTNLEVLKSENIYGNLYKSRLADKVEYTNFIKENYKIVSEACGGDKQKCFAPSSEKKDEDGNTVKDEEDNIIYETIYKNLNNEQIDVALSGGYGFLTKGGYSMYIVPADASKQTPVLVHVDVNASELPNIIGRDFFSFKIYEDYSIDVITPTERRTAGAKNLRAGLAANASSDDNGAACKASVNGFACFGRLLNNNFKVDY